MVALLTLLVVMLEISLFFVLYCHFFILGSFFKVVKRRKTIKYCLNIFQGVLSISPYGTYLRIGGVLILCSVFYFILTFIIRGYQVNLWPDLLNFELLTFGIYLFFKASKYEPSKFEWHCTVIASHRLKYNKIPRRGKYVSDAKLFKLKFYKPKVQIVRESRTKRIREPQ
jgi:hypothetical protein